MNSAAAKTEKITTAQVSDELIIQSLARLDPIALGVALGVLFALVIFLATNLLILKGGGSIGPTLSLLGQYFVGYRVTFGGSLIGLIYGFLSGFILGWLLAFLRNTIITIYLFILQLKGNITTVNDFIDQP